MSIAFQSSFVDSNDPLPKQLGKKKLFLVYFPFSGHPFLPACSLSQRLDTAVSGGSLDASFVLKEGGGLPCLRLRTFTAGNTGSIPGQETKILHAPQYDPNRTKIVRKENGHL